MKILFRIQNLRVLQSLVRFFIVTLLERNNKIQTGTNRVRVKDLEIKNVNIFIVLTSSSRVKIESGVKQIGTLLFLREKFVTKSKVNSLLACLSTVQNPKIKLSRMSSAVISLSSRVPNN